MNVLAALISNLDPATIDPPLTNSTGGTSIGDFNAGSDTAQPLIFDPLTTGDKAGAGIVTAIIIACALGAMTWMNLD